MPVGDPGNESHQYVPGGAYNRVYVGNKGIGGYSGRTWTYDPSTPATNTFTDSNRADFSKDLSQGQFANFLQSPRLFWMRYRAGFNEKYSTPTFTINSRIGRLAEASTDQLRTQTPLPTVGTLPFFAGTPLANMVPFVHPTDSDFTDDILGRHPTGEYKFARARGVLYGRASDPYPRLNVYGMPDDLFEFEDEDGQKWMVIVDYKSTTTPDLQAKLNTWWDIRDQPYHRPYMTQLEFYAWLMERIIQREGLSHQVWPIGYHVVFNIGQSGQANLSGASLSLNLESGVTQHEMDWSWIEPTIDLAIECLLDNTPPPKQGVPGPPNRRTGAASTSVHYHPWDIIDDRYDWLQTNHPGSWP